jgi:hypothetical protein
VPALLPEHDSAVREAIAHRIEDPVELDVANAKGYKRIEAAVNSTRIVAALERRHQTRFTNAPDGE